MDISFINPGIGQNLNAADVNKDVFTNSPRESPMNWGSDFRNVDPAGTTQRSSNRSEIVKKDLAVRAHICPTCRIKINSRV